MFDTIPDYTLPVTLDSFLDELDCDKDVVKQKLISSFPLSEDEHCLVKIMFGWTDENKMKLRGTMNKPHITMLNWFLVRNPSIEFLFDFDLRKDLMYLLQTTYPKLYQDETILTKQFKFIGQRKIYSAVELKLPEVFEESVIELRQKILKYFEKKLAEKKNIEIDEEGYSIYNYNDKYYVILSIIVSGKKTPFLMLPLYDYFPTKGKEISLNPHFSLGEKKDFSEEEISYLTNFYSENQLSFQVIEGKIFCVVMYKEHSYKKKINKE